MGAEVLSSPAVSHDPLEAVLLRAQGGDLEAFEELVVLTETKVLGLSWKLLGSRDQAQDAAQETFLRIYRFLDTFRPGESAKAWMYRITVNVCNDLARKRGPVMAGEDILETRAPHLPPAAMDAVLQEERRNLARKALGSLTPAERKALTLRDLEGLPTEEVARILKVRPVTVRSQVASARSKMRAFCMQMVPGLQGGGR